MHKKIVNPYRLALLNCGLEARVYKKHCHLVQQILALYNSTRCVMRLNQAVDLYTL